MQRVMEPSNPDVQKSITRLRSGRFCEQPHALALSLSKDLPASGGDPHAGLVPP